MRESSRWNGKWMESKWLPPLARRDTRSRSLAHSLCRPLSLFTHHSEGQIDRYARA